MATLKLFVTGTDTEIGKTHVACALLRSASARGLRCAGFKPIAAGAAENQQGQLRNEDALALMAASNVELPYERVNPVCFKPAIAPHIAAKMEDISVDVDNILTCEKQISSQCDLVVIEGAGGWRVPINEQMDFADLVALAGWPVVLVCGMRLGCINHSLLSAESIARRANLLGWVANVLPPRQTALEDNLLALQRRMPAPCLGRLDENQDREDAIMGEILSLI